MLRKRKSTDDHPDTPELPTLARITKVSQLALSVSLSLIKRSPRVAVSTATAPRAPVHI
jgi:hypothetical protein